MQMLSFCFYSLHKILCEGDLQSKFTAFIKIAIILENTILDVQHPLADDDRRYIPGSCKIIESLTSSMRDDLLKTIMIIIATVNIANTNFVYEDYMFEYVARVDFYWQLIFCVNRDDEHFNKEEEEDVQEIKDIFNDIFNSIFFIKIVMDNSILGNFVDPEDTVVGPSEACAVCWNGLEGADFSILCYCPHTFCVGCTRVWFREK